MKIGIYGGSFNPIHSGHVNLAETAIETLGLDKLFIIPVGNPWYKKDNVLVRGEHRYNMCRLAFRGNEKVEILDYEINKKERSYTVSTVHWLKSQYPLDEFYLIMGCDMFLTLEKWVCYDELKHMVTFGVAARNFETDEIISSYRKKLEASGARVMTIPVDVVPVSSSEIREELLTKGDTNDIPKNVESYIKQNSLYGSDAEKYVYPLEEYRLLVKSMVEEKRYIHSLNVADSAVYLAEKYGYNTHIARTAGLLHDICKRMPVDEQIKLIKSSYVKWDDLTFQSEKILHGISGAEYIFNELGVYNLDIINAVRYHTTARPDMGLLEKIVYVADVISAERNYPDVDTVRKLADEDLDKTVGYVAAYNFDNLFSHRSPITEMTVKTYNYYSIDKK